MPCVRLGPCALGPGPTPVPEPRARSLAKYDRLMLPTIEWQPDAVVMIDQRKLPTQEVYVHCKTAPEVARAIKTMVIRGAPAIGVAAAMGIAMGMRKSKAQGTKQFAVEFTKSERSDGGDAADGGESVLGDRADEAVVRGRRAGRRVRRRVEGPSRARGPRDSRRRSSRAAGPWADSAPTSCRTTRGS